MRAVLLYSRHTIVDNDSAITILDEALALDPDLAAAHALLAAACVERFFTFAPQEQKALEEKAYVAVERAIALDPDESMAWFARGRLLWTPSNRFPHERAIRDYRRALALNPNSAEARAQLALTYNHVGLLEDALREARAAADINPIDALPRVVIGQALLYGGQYERALSVWSSNPPEAYSSVTGFPYCLDPISDGAQGGGGRQDHADFLSKISWRRWRTRSSERCCLRYREGTARQK